MPKIFNKIPFLDEAMWDGVKSLFRLLVGEPAKEAATQYGRKTVEKYSRTHIIKAVISTLRATHAGNLDESEIAAGTEEALRFVSRQDEDKQDTCEDVLFGETLYAAMQMTSTDRIKTETEFINPKTGKVTKRIKAYANDEALVLHREFMAIFGSLSEPDQDMVYNLLHQEHKLLRMLKNTGGSIADAVRNALSTTTLSGTTIEQIGEAVERSGVSVRYKLDQRIAQLRNS